MEKIITFNKATESGIDSIPISDNNIIFEYTNQKIYMDSNGKRSVIGKNCNAKTLYTDNNTSTEAKINKINNALIGIERHSNLMNGIKNYSIILLNKFTTEENSAYTVSQSSDNVIIKKLSEV